MAGTIGAASNNGMGVTGVSWQSRIVPVRVLGRCGGTISDIADGMYWAAGLSVPGTLANANPAHVLNMSLGGSGAYNRSTRLHRPPQRGRGFGCRGGKLKRQRF